MKYFLLIIAYLGYSNIYAASFDCNKAKSFAEKTVCVDSELSQMDDELGKTYKSAKAASGNSTEFVNLNRERWLWREKNCVDRQCLANWYRTRIAELGNTVTKTAERNEVNNAGGDSVQLSNLQGGGKSAENIKYDGFRSEVERKYMLEHGFNSRQALNLYVNSSVDKRLKISAANFMRTIDLDVALKCFVISAVLANSSDNSPEFIRSFMIVQNIYELTLNEMVGMKVIDKSSMMSAMKSKLLTEDQKFNSSSQEYRKQQIIIANSCQERAEPYFSDVAILKYR